MNFNTTEQDFQGALNGILLLQDTYDFDVQSANSRGTIDYVNHENQLISLEAGETLKKEDLVKLAKLAKERKMFDRAINYMLTAIR